MAKRFSAISFPDIPGTSDALERSVRDRVANVLSKKQGTPGKVVGKVSLATSNAKNLFSKYLKEFSGAESDKQASVAAVTEKIRRHMGKVRPA